MENKAYLFRSVLVYLRLRYKHKASVLSVNQMYVWGGFVLILLPHLAIYSTLIQRSLIRYYRYTTSLAPPIPYLHVTFCWACYKIVLRRIQCQGLHSRFVCLEGVKDLSLSDVEDADVSLPASRNQQLMIRCILKDCGTVIMASEGWRIRTPEFNRFGTVSSFQS